MGSWIGISSHKLKKSSVFSSIGLFDGEEEFLIRECILDWPVFSFLFRMDNKV
jgi:hypothetical protein